MLQDNPVYDAALKLDPSDDKHWTSQNLPAINVLNGFLSKAGYEPVNRATINEAIPEFTRPIKIENKVENSDGFSFEFKEGQELSEEYILELREKIKAGDVLINNIEKEIYDLKHKAMAVRKQVHIIASKIKSVVPNFSDLHRINRENQRKRLEDEELKQKKLVDLMDNLDQD